jgi:ABC-type antimicrobial peptide transport system permease subunit
VVTERLMEELGVDSAAGLIGQPLVISASVSVIDSGLTAVVGEGSGQIRELMQRVSMDSLRIADYRNRILRRELSSAASRFMQGYLNHQALVVDTLEIVGILEDGHRRRTRIQPIIIPPAAARKFDSVGATADPTDLMAMLKQGSLPGMAAEGPGEGYSMVTINMDPTINYAALQDTVEALGFRTFSFAEQFDEIRQAFRYFYLALAMIGFVAMFTAALGIINTLVMSITERRKEIGLLKSLGADERQISIMYLAESATIGLIGGAGGVLVGWTVSRIASAIAKSIMRGEGVDPIELFALPLWLIGLAMGFSIVISMLAGSYPAIRAARVDPVEALRGE